MWSGEFKDTLFSLVLIKTGVNIQTETRRVQFSLSPAQHCSWGQKRCVFEALWNVKVGLVGDQWSPSAQLWTNPVPSFRCWTHYRNFQKGSESAACPLLPHVTQSFADVFGWNEEVEVVALWPWMNNHKQRKSASPVISPSPPLEVIVDQIVGDTVWWRVQVMWLTSRFLFPLSAPVLGGLCAGGAGQYLYQLLCPLLLWVCQRHGLSLHAAARHPLGHTRSHMGEHHLLAACGECPNSLL